MKRVMGVVMAALPVLGLVVPGVWFALDLTWRTSALVHAQAPVPTPWPSVTPMPTWVPPDKPASYSPPLHTPELTCKAMSVTGREVYRSAGRRAMFVYMTGGARPGYVVNHIVPLACGGCDVPSNMEWMTVAGWKGRTGAERYDCGRHPGGSW